MRLKITESKNAKSLYVIRSTYENGKHSSKIVEKLGTYAALSNQLNGLDPVVWAKQYIAELNRKEKEENQEVLLTYAPAKRIKKEEQRAVTGGYLFLQQLFFQLGLPAICQQITKRHKFSFDLSAILSRLVYARMLYPASKLATLKLAASFIEPPKFDLHHMYRALEVIAAEGDFIQSALYQQSLRISPRNTHILYYDCTNYFFEIEQEAGLRKYGLSKEHRPNPIVQMGLFMDGDGIPLAFSLSKGNTNEQITLTPLEKRILKDFHLSRVIVCTDAGLSSTANRKFNNKTDRAFITTQSVKNLKSHLLEWALSPDGWFLPGDTHAYHLNQWDAEESLPHAVANATFYKERWIHEDGLEQRLIITFSFKYQTYQRHIRNAQIERAVSLIQKQPQQIGKVRPTDCKRFITQTAITAEGEVAQKKRCSLNTTRIAQEERFDGFYGVCTNLESRVTDIIRINHQRWQIEECFRIMKTEFKARPVYLSRDDRITAHFTTCFLALTVYRFLEKKLKEAFTCNEIIRGLQAMNFYKVTGEGYIPTYTRTDFTDALHHAFGFQTDYQFISTQQMRKIIKASKKQ